jgi:hypothetical protein
MPTDTPSNGLYWAGWALTALVALFLLFDGATKLLRVPPVMEACARVGLTPDMAAAIGAVLLACTALYVIPATAVVGVILLTAFLGGAVAIHVRGGSGVVEIAFAIGFCGLAWLALVLRDLRLLWAILLRA